VIYDLTTGIDPADLALISGPPRNFHLDKEARLPVLLWDHPPKSHSRDYRVPVGNFAFLLASGKKVHE
jgi:hypothetical protein